MIVFSEDVITNWAKTFGMPMEFVQRLVSLLESADGPRDVDTFESRMTEALGVPLAETKRIIEGLFGLYSYMVFQSIPAQKIAWDLIDGLGEIAVDKELAKSLVTRMLLADHPVSLTAYAYAANSSSRVNFLHASVSPAIVPIQTWDRAAPAQAVMLRYELKIACKQDGETRNQSFTLNSDGIRALAEELGRALQSDASLRKQIGEWYVEIMEFPVE